ncbi:Ankyrin repeat-containing protein [Glarea lozoyensis ATCC 20868]|uniref:Ankyrin repeat-containing protein n=1 Tax=Glarea lozoyensis (strain ATCC 20868 / MF5171) TaxID=1116229 RepID=S3DE59_GLAL2|nr:Ankyrin repeat-containing protein [Glarea lozoyensis ATCC 20868]EPE35379.1 Ankyrin repeat-containing protein [Glarea lozoyensis ATCC 20868]
MPPKETPQAKNKGGRPKAAWTPRRDQKAVHLYTLTKLTMLAISVEMKEEGFAPSESATQKRLKDLLPKNQVQDINVFRPRDEENMKLRFETLKACHGQVNTRRMREKNDRHRRRLKRRTRRAKRIAQFDGPQQAFKAGCSDSLIQWGLPCDSLISNSDPLPSKSVPLTPAHSPLEFIDPKLVESTVSQLGHYDKQLQEEDKADDTSPQPAALTDDFNWSPYVSVNGVATAMKEGDPLLAVAELTAPFIISPYTDTSPLLCEEIDEYLGELPGTSVTARETQVTEEDQLSLPLFFSWEEEEEVQRKSDHAQVVLDKLSKQISDVTLQPKRFVLLKYDTIFKAEHTKLVSRFSGASSTKSSLMSWASHLTSHRSYGSSIHSVRTGSSGSKVKAQRGFSAIAVASQDPLSLVEEQALPDTVNGSTTVVPPLRMPATYSSKEEEAWLELVGKPNAKSYSSLSGSARACCRANAPICHECGIRTTAFQQWKQLPRASQPSGELDMIDLVIDFYGNTPLHWAAHYSASSLVLSSYESSWSIRKASPVHSTPFLGPQDLAERYNTLGETVLHCLKITSTAEIIQYSDIIRLIADGRSVRKSHKHRVKQRDCHKVQRKRKHDFNRRDCHGRTIIHRFLLQLSEDLLHEVLPEKGLTNLLDMTSIPLDATDNQGETLFDILVAREVPLEFYSGLDFRATLDTTLAKVFGGFTDTRPVVYSALSFIEPQFSLLIIPEFCAKMLDINWIDLNGDTILHAVIKYDITKDPQRVEVLLHQGADLGIKDRKGNTALSIAVNLGSLGITRLLLKSGANVHSRNYGGTGILMQAAEHMRSTKQDKNHQLGNEILSCTNLLIDHGAIPNPADMDEWMTAEGRTALSASL